MEPENSTSGRPLRRSSRSRKHRSSVKGDNDGMRPSKKRMLKTPTVKVESTIVDLFNNSLVAENIASFLTFGDLRAATEVSVDFCRSIRSTRRFQKSAALVLCKRNDTDNFDWSKLLKKSIFPWRAIRVDVTWANEVSTKPALCHLMKTCEFLSVIPNNPMQNPRGSFDLSASTLGELLLSAPKLTQLQIDTRLLKEAIVTNPLSADVVFMPMNLRRLDLLEWNSDSDVFSRDNSRSKFKLQTHGDEDDDMIFKPPTCQYISSLLTNNSTTLEELCLEGALWSLEEMKTLNFPLLKKLVALVDSVDTQQSLADFLNRHAAALEELDVLVKPRRDGGNDDDQDNVMALEKPLFVAIGKGSRNLRKLHLSFHKLSPRLLRKEGLWAFLGRMTKLKDFSLGRPNYDSYFSYAKSAKRHEVLASLATLPEGQLESLAIQRCHFSDFWGEAAETTRRQNLRGQLQLQKNIFRDFSSLRRLSLFRSCVVDNDLLQFIFRKFVHLKELEVGDCKRLTSEGFTGERRDSQGKLVKFGASVNRLSQLKHLSIFLNQPVKQYFVLFHKVKLPQLKFFEYLDLSRVPELQVLTLARNNPSLETVATDFLNANSAAALLSDAREEGLRLRRTIHLRRSFVSGH